MTQLMKRESQMKELLPCTKKLPRHRWGDSSSFFDSDSDPWCHRKGARLHTCARAAAYALTATTPARAAVTLADCRYEKILGSIRIQAVYFLSNNDIYHIWIIEIQHWISKY
jgi:hypothetical protein